MRATSWQPLQLLGGFKAFFLLLNLNFVEKHSLPNLTTGEKGTVGKDIQSESPSDIWNSYVYFLK